MRNTPSVKFLEKIEDDARNEAYNHPNFDFGIYEDDNGDVVYPIDRTPSEDFDSGLAWEKWMMYFDDKTKYHCTLDAFVDYLINGRIGAKPYIDYLEYIKSPLWHEKSFAAKDRAGWRCQVCSMSGRYVYLNTHHNTYKRLGEEIPEDLVVLCSSCHQLYEKEGKLKKNHKKESNHA